MTLSWLAVTTAVVVVGASLFGWQALARGAVGVVKSVVLRVGTDGECLPRHQTHFQPSFH